MAAGTAIARMIPALFVPFFAQLVLRTLPSPSPLAQRAGAILAKPSCRLQRGHPTPRLESQGTELAQGSSELGVAEHGAHLRAVGADESIQAGVQNG